MSKFKVGDVVYVVGSPTEEDVTVIHVDDEEYCTVRFEDGLELMYNDYDLELSNDHPSKRLSPRRVH